MIIVDLDGQARVHLRRALASHQRWCLTNGIPFPAELEPLLVRTGQEWTRDDETDHIPHACDVPLAYSYREAGSLLGVSEKTVRRLVDDGELHAVTIGDRNRRIPRQELVEYLANLHGRGVNVTARSEGREGANSSPHDRPAPVRPEERVG